MDQVRSMPCAAIESLIQNAQEGADVGIHGENRRFIAFSRPVPSRNPCGSSRCQSVRGCGVEDHRSRHEVERDGSPCGSSSLHAAAASCARWTPGCGGVPPSW
jgi:hypothetical protein